MEAHVGGDAGDDSDTGLTNLRTIWIWPRVGMGLDGMRFCWVIWEAEQKV